MFTSVIKRDRAAGGYTGPGSAYLSVIGSDTSADRDYMKKTVRVYLYVSLVTVIFGHVYEHFSHGVYSREMFWAFLIPLFAGAGVFRAVSLLNLRTPPDKNEMMLYHWGIAALTAGSLFQGVLEIYGTENPLVKVYGAAGAALIALGVIKYIVRLSKR